MQPAAVGRAGLPPGATSVVLAAGAGLLLGLLTVAVALDWWPVAVDHAVVRHLPTGHPTGAVALLLTVSGVVVAVATPAVFLPLTVAVAACWSWRERSAACLRTTAIAVSVLAASVLAGKALLDRPGPPGSPPHHLLGYYPSGHTTTAAVCVGVLALLAGRRRPSLRVPLLAAAALWTVIVGAALVIHRYHWPSDVVAGLLLGGLILVLLDRFTSGPEMTTPTTSMVAGRGSCGPWD